jgi:hypothetical protein
LHRQHFPAAKSDEDPNEMFGHIRERARALFC